MTAKFTHAATKRAERSRLVKTKKPDIVLAPTPMLFQRLILKDGTRGIVLEYRGTADRQVYVLQDTWGNKVEFTREQVASYK